MVVNVVKSPTFNKKLKKADKGQLDRIRKLIIKIMNSPYIGKPMRYNRKGTREVYQKPFRVSYSYQEENETLYLLDIYHKDKQ